MKKHISIRIEEEQLDKLRKLLGLDDDSKAIRGAINFTVNVAHHLFDGNLNNMFKRKRTNEERPLYEKSI